MNPIPTSLLASMLTATWQAQRKAAHAVLRRVVPSIDPVELFATADAAERVTSQLLAAGFVGDPEFCLVESQSSLTGNTDPRMSWNELLCIGGSIQPGDDSFIVVDLRSSRTDPEVFAFDWSRPVPNRWVPVGRLGEFLRMLREHTEAIQNG